MKLITGRSVATLPCFSDIMNSLFGCCAGVALPSSIADRTYLDYSNPELYSSLARLRLAEEW
jgi:hypothetical protein